MNPGKWHLPVIAAIVLLAFTLSAQAQDNVAGSSEPIVTSIDPAKLTFDYLVDANLAHDDPAARQFTALQSAYAAAPAGTEARPTVIGIKPNVYQISGSPAPGASLRITKNWITLLGLTNNRRSVVLADNRGLDEGAGDDGFLLDVNATGFTARNLTILNYCNCDYEYPGDAAKNLKMRNPTITQAVALQAAGDKHVYENVAILGRLDTMFLRTARSYFKNVFIEGTDDWMGGGQMSVWQDCELVYPTGRGVMSASNVVFFNCKFAAKRGLEFYKAEFGSAARPDALINCQFPISTANARVAWVRGIAAPRPNQYTLTYNNKDANGNPAIIYDDTSSAPAFTYSRELSEKELQAYNPWNLLRAAPSADPDDWDPAGVRPKYENSQNPVYRIALRGGNARPGARTGGSAAVASPWTSPIIRTGGPGVTLSATVSPGYATDPTINWSSKSGLVALSRSTGPDVVVTGNNTTDDAQYVPITTMASNGFYVTAYIYIQPKFIDPPTFTSALKLEPPSNGKVTADYSLDLRGREDQSVITWFTCDNAAGANPKTIAVSRGNQPLKTFTLMPGDVGKFLRVSVEPRHAVSDPGPPVFAISSAPIAASDIPSSTVSVNFRNFVETPSDALTAGLWTIQGPWAVVAGDNLLNGFGIRAGAGNRGDRTGGTALLYFKAGDTRDMQVDLLITPDKTEGTVFAVSGSPNDSGPHSFHGDIFIKYDPITRTGYSLRYWRTTQSAAACVYQFYKIENGVGSPLNDTQVLSGVFKPSTSITLKAIGSTISVQAGNSVDEQTLTMQATIIPNHFSGAGVSATGAASIYSQIRVSYP